MVPRKITKYCTDTFKLHFNTEYLKSYTKKRRSDIKKFCIWQALSDHLRGRYRIRCFLWITMKEEQRFCTKQNYVCLSVGLYSLKTYTMYMYIHCFVWLFFFQRPNFTLGPVHDSHSLRNMGESCWYWTWHFYTQSKLLALKLSSRTPRSFLNSVT